MKNLLFYYPRHFNRSARGTNPFFDPLLEACDEAGIPYDLYEEPDNGTDKPRNEKAKSATCFYWTITVLRKIVSILRRDISSTHRDRIAARIFNFITLGRWKYKTYVSISGSMESIFLALNPKAKVIEMQHGLDCANKVSYFADNQLYEAYRSPNWHLLSWGEGFRQSVLLGHEKELEGRVHVVGCPTFQATKPTERHPEFIVFSLQFTHDWAEPKRQKAKDFLVETLEQLRDCGHPVLLKHHPRFNNSIDLSDIYERFPFVTETKEPLHKLQARTLLHVTFYSTTAFEFAAAGIPTFFMANDDFPEGKTLFYEEYRYPVYEGMKIGEVVKKLENSDDETTMKKWYESFYLVFDKQKFINFVTQ